MCPLPLHLLALAFLACPAQAQAPAQAPAQVADKAAPNVILIITDDQGYGDLGCHGNTMIQTPRLDQLYQESVRWTHYHVDPTCSPTRSALMSGRYSTRTGVWHTIMGRSLMDTSEYTVAEMFRDGGYRTGMFGKWHLGDNYPQRPQDQGFEHVVWHHGGGVGQGPDYWDNDYFDDTYEVNGNWKSFEGYCTDVWFQEATAFIEEASDERPFFVYLSTNAPHGPFLVDPVWSEPYVERGVSATMAKFYGMISNIDHNVGLLRDRLEELGLAKNTLLIFTTDNGTAAGEARRQKEPGTWEGFRCRHARQEGFGVRGAGIGCPSSPPGPAGASAVDGTWRLSRPTWMSCRPCAMCAASIASPACPSMEPASRKRCKAGERLPADARCSFTPNESSSHRSGASAQ